MSTPSGQPPALELAALRRLLRRPKPSPEERCDFCAEPLLPEHRHLLEGAAREVRCVCHPCSILFDRDAASLGKYRLIPRRKLALRELRVPDAQWKALGVPVGLAYFTRGERSARADSLESVGSLESMESVEGLDSLESVGGSGIEGTSGPPRHDVRTLHTPPTPRPSGFPVTAWYPGPAGAVDADVDPGAWSELCRQSAALQSLEPAVEALLVNRIRPESVPPRYYLVPIDECFRLVGLVRSRWRGMTGGTEIWEEVERFFAELDRQCGSQITRKE